MDLSMRVATAEERLYAYAQSQQISNMCGSPGYLRGDFYDGAVSFYFTWERNQPQYKTVEFQLEFDAVMDALRLDGAYDKMLDTHKAMVAYCKKHPEAAFDGNLGTEYVFRADTEAYTYIIRCIPQIGDNNFYVFPYKREWLDTHMKNAQHGIPIKDATYRELFRVPDGEKIRIISPNGRQEERVCRYIDDFHFETDNGWGSIYHVDQFAELMARCGNRVELSRREKKEHVE